MLERENGSPGQKLVTIYHVAREAGVAPSTVSRAFSRPGRVNAETAERIRRVAYEMGYRTRPVARGLTTARTGMTALVIADITNPYYTDIVLGAQEAATVGGYTMLVIDTQESDRRERAALERAMPAIDGIVLASSRMSDSAIRMMSKQKPVVVLNRAITGVPCVVTDNAMGARRVAEHFRDLGHSRITYVAGPEASWSDGMRWRLLREAAVELELKVHRVGPFTPDVDGGVRAAEEVHAHPTSAVVAYNAQIAIGLMREFARTGVRVPQDMSLVGYDNTFVADLVTPGLTTVAAPVRAEGATAMEHLLSMIEGAPGRTGQPVVVPVRLVVRASTAPRGQRPSCLPATDESPAVSTPGP
jgi:LacI family transcriptional regulator